MVVAARAAAHLQVRGLEQPQRLLLERALGDDQLQHGAEVYRGVSSGGTRRAPGRSTCARRCGRPRPPGAPVASTTSASQSTRSSCQCWTWPLVSPLRQSSWRERTNRPSGPRPACAPAPRGSPRPPSAPAPLSASCAITGIRPRSSKRRARRGSGRRTGIPSAARWSLTCAIVRSPTWNRLAASTASADRASAVGEVLELAGAAARDHRHAASRRATARKQLEVVALAGAVAVHRGEQDLAGAALARSPRPPSSTASRPVAVRPASTKTSQPLAARASRRSRPPRTARRTGRRSAAAASGSRTAAVLSATLSAPARSSARTSSRLRTPPPTVSGMNTCSAVRAITSSRRVAALDRGGDVEEHQLVGALAVVAGGELDRVARVAQVLEPRALHDAAGVDVEAGDHRAWPARPLASDHLRRASSVFS